MKCRSLLDMHKNISQCPIYLISMTIEYGFVYLQRRWSHVNSTLHFKGILIGYLFRDSNFLANSYLIVENLHQFQGLSIDEEKNRRQNKFQKREVVICCPLYTFSRFQLYTVNDVCNSEFQLLILWCHLLKRAAQELKSNCCFNDDSPRNLCSLFICCHDGG